MKINRVIFISRIIFLISIDYSHATDISIEENKICRLIPQRIFPTLFIQSAPQLPDVLLMLDSLEHFKEKIFLTARLTSSLGSSLIFIVGAIASEYFFNLLRIRPIFIKNCFVSSSNARTEFQMSRRRLFHLAPRLVHGSPPLYWKRSLPKDPFPAEKPIKIAMFCPKKKKTRSSEGPAFRVTPPCVTVALSTESGVSR